MRRRRPVLLLLGLVLVAAALVVVAPGDGDDGEGGRAGRGVVVTEVGGIVHAARSATKRAPALALLLLAVLGVAVAAVPRAWCPAPDDRAGHRARPVLLRAVAGRAPPRPARTTTR